MSSFTFACYLDTVSSRTILDRGWIRFLIEQLLLLDSEHMFTHYYVSVCVCVYGCCCRHTLASLLCLPQTSLCGNYGDHKYAGGQTANTPGLPAPTLCLSLPPTPSFLSRFPASVALGPWRLHRHSSAGLLTHWPSCFLFYSPLRIQAKTFSFRPSPHRQVVVFYVLFGAQWNASRGFWPVKSHKHPFSLTNIWQGPYFSAIQVVCMPGQWYVGAH